MPANTIDANASDSIAGAALTPDEVDEFLALLREATAADVSEHEAWNSAIELIALVRMLLGPVPEDR